MKLNPSKFKVSQEVTFGGCKISSKNLTNETRKTFIDPAQEKIQNLATYLLLKQEDMYK